MLVKNFLLLCLFQIAGVYCLAGLAYIFIHLLEGNRTARFVALEATLLFGAAFLGRQVRYGFEPVRRWRVFLVVLGIQLAPPLLLMLAQIFSDAEIPKLYQFAKLTYLIEVQPLGVFALLALDPLAEELLFRGWLWEALRTRFSLKTVAICTFLVFVLIHATTIQGAVGAAYGAALLTAVRFSTGSLYASIAVHSLQNALVILYGKYPF